jgi:hypothetical protein
MALYIVNKTSDVSNLAGGLTKDCVGLDTRGYIAAGNTQGRAWGAYSNATAIDATCEGQLIAHECNTFNNTGVNATGIGLATSKHGLFIQAGGNAQSTAAVYIGSYGAPALWNFGIFSVSTSYASGANFIDYRNGALATLFGVQQDGQQKFLIGSSIKDAANDGAAAAAGVPLGGIYYDSTASNVLKIRTV